MHRVRTSWKACGFEYQSTYMCMVLNLRETCLKSPACTSANRKSAVSAPSEIGHPFRWSRAAVWRRLWENRVQGEWCLTASIVTQNGQLVCSFWNFLFQFGPRGKWKSICGARPSDVACAAPGEVWPRHEPDPAAGLVTSCAIRQPVATANTALHQHGSWAADLNSGETRYIPGNWLSLCLWRGGGILYVVQHGKICAGYGFNNICRFMLPPTDAGSSWCRSTCCADGQPKCAAGFVLPIFGWEGLFSFVGPPRTWCVEGTRNVWIHKRRT